MPRSAHGDWQPASDRPAAVEVLVGQAVTRVPELVPIEELLPPDAAHDETERVGALIASYANSLADQNERDHQALADAVAAGTVIAEQGI
jgi:hypothetical protein